jgi:hypothetical protein
MLQSIHTFRQKQDPPRDICAISGKHFKNLSNFLEFFEIVGQNSLFPLLKHHCFPGAISTVSFCYRKKEKNVAPFVPLHKNSSDTQAS